MILRITYCTVVLLLCIGLGLLIEAPGHLIAETEPDRIQADENSEELLIRSIVLNTFKEKKQNLSRLTSQQILNNALQRELSSNEGFQQAPMLQIFPATVKHRCRKNRAGNPDRDPETRASSWFLRCRLPKIPSKTGSSINPICPMRKTSSRNPCRLCRSRKSSPRRNSTIRQGGWCCRGRTRVLQQPFLSVF